MLTLLRVCCRDMERKAVAAWRAKREAANAALAAQSARQQAVEQEHREAVRQLRMAEAKALLEAQKARQVRVPTTEGRLCSCRACSRVQGVKSKFAMHIRGAVVIKGSHAHRTSDSG